MTIGMKKLSSKTLKKVYNRHYQLLGCFNYERQMSTGYAWTMMPAIRELYGDDEVRMKAGVKRHLEFFNCATTPSPFIIGITCAMEEQCASVPEGEFDVASINSVKAALMGPLAGIGDSFFWGTFRVIGVGVGAPLAVAGNILGPMILGDTTGLSAFWVIFAILIFGKFLGFAGMFIGVPVFAVVYSVIKKFIAIKLQKKGLPSETAAYADNPSKL